MSKTKYGIQVDAWAALIPGKGSVSQEVYQHVWKTLNEKLPYLVRQEDVEKPRNVTLVADKLSFDYFLSPLISTTPDQSHKPRPHMLVCNRLTGFTQYAVAVRIARWGDNDLEVSWRILEKDFVQSVIEPGLHVLAIALLGLYLWQLWQISQLFIPGDLGEILKDVGRYISEVLHFLLWATPGVIVAAMFILWVSFIIGRLRRRADGTDRTWLDTYDQYDSRMLALEVSGVIWEALDAQAIAPSDIRELRRRQKSDVARIEGWNDI